MTAKYVMGDFGKLNYNKLNHFQMGLSPLPVSDIKILTKAISFRPSNQAPLVQPYQILESDLTKNYVYSLPDSPASTLLKSHVLTSEELANYRMLENNGFTPKAGISIGKTVPLDASLASKTSLKEMVDSLDQRQGLTYQDAKVQNGSTSDSTTASTSEKQSAGKFLAVGGAALAALFIFGKE